MDEAFLPFHQMVASLLDFAGDIHDEDAGVHMYIAECEIEAPLELDVLTGEQGGLQIGSVPPLYSVDTTFRPSYHRLRFTAERTEVSHGQ